MGLIPRKSKSGGTKTHYVHHSSGGGGGGGTPLETWEILVIVFSIVWFIYFCCCIYYYKKKEPKDKENRGGRILFKALLLALILPYIGIKLTRAIRGRFFNKGQANRSNDTYNSLEDQATLLPQSQSQVSQPQMRETVATADSAPPAYAGATAGRSDGRRFEPMRVPTLPVYQQGEYNPDAAAAYAGPPASSSNVQHGAQRHVSPLNV